MGHFGEIRLADPVFSAVVLPTVSVTLTALVLSIRLAQNSAVGTLSIR